MEVLTQKIDQKLSKIVACEYRDHHSLPKQGENAAFYLWPDSVPFAPKTARTTTMTTIMMRTIKISIQDWNMSGIKHTDYAEADPLLPPSGPCFLDCSVELCVAFPDIFSDLLSLLFNLSDSWFLLDNQGLQVLEELGEFHHLLLDFLDILMSSSDILRGLLCFASSVALDELTEHQ